ncbi:MAG: hypothetical protein H7841_01860 [Magnetospirillum sp. WYHS-4]
MRLFRVTAVLLLSAGGADAGDSAGRTWAWAESALRAELTAERPDLNKVASLSFPLATRYPRSSALDKAAVFLRRQDPERLACGDLADYLLIAGFLAGSGRKLDSRAAAARFAGCRRATSLFDLAGGLLFDCRFGGSGKADPRDVARLAAGQRPDGSFAEADGRSNFYLTSHATLALFHCQGPPVAVRRGQAHLEWGLPHLRRAGMLDELAEALVFLRWMGVAAAQWDGHAAHVLSRARPDGGLCLLDAPGCPAHWHATSLLLELGGLMTDQGKGKE